MRVIKNAFRKIEQMCQKECDETSMLQKSKEMRENVKENKCASPPAFASTWKCMSNM